MLVRKVMYSVPEIMLEGFNPYWQIVLVGLAAQLVNVSEKVPLARVYTKTAMLAMMKPQLT